MEMVRDFFERNVEAMYRLARREANKETVGMNQGQRDEILIKTQTDVKWMKKWMEDAPCDDMRARVSEVETGLAVLHNQERRRNGRAGVWGGAVAAAVVVLDYLLFRR